MRPYRGLVFLAAFTVLLWTGTVLAGPLLMRHGIDAGIKRNDPNALNLAIVIYLVAIAIGYLVYRCQVYLIGLVGERFLFDLRTRVFDHLQRLSMSFYDRQQAGVVVSRMTSDIDALSELTQTGLVLFISNVALLGFSGVVLTFVSWRLMLVCLLSLPFIVISSVRFSRRSSVAFLTIRDRIGDTLSQLQEGIAGVRVIQAFGREDHEVGRFSHRNRELYDAHLAAARISAFYTPKVEFAGLATTALVVFIGGWMVGNNLATIGTMTFFVLTLSNLFEPIQQLSNLFTLVQQSVAGLVKVYELLDTPVENQESPDAVELPSTGALSVTGVTFGYNTDAPVLVDVNLRLEEGERMALVGSTGAGKSTLAKLMARFYDPTEGVVDFGGTDLRDATFSSLRQRIVVVPQEGFLLNGTIRENVRLGRMGATDTEVEQALIAIGAYERFEMLADGLDTEVNERGSRLSAGERQLVSLARAALADPTVLILDEATSSLDPGTEALVESAMEHVMRGRSTVVIAHRLSTAERADRVGVVDDGRLVQIGSHAELIEVEGPYAQMYATWKIGLPQT
jgi:ATP-binding cassette subfamily B protein